MCVVKLEDLRRGDSVANNSEDHAPGAAATSAWTTAGATIV